MQKYKQATLAENTDVRSRAVIVEACDIRAHKLSSLLQFIDFDVALSTAEAALQDVESSETPLTLFIGWPGSEKELAKRIENFDAETPLILVADPGQVDDLSDALRRRFVQHLEMPCTFDAMQQGLDAVRRHRLRHATSQAGECKGLDGMSPAMQRLRRAIVQVARTESTVLVLGETGTGKEVVARNIHNCSSRRDKPFVAVNCGAIPAELLESELFGHEKGAFTGALSTRQGRFELAHGGTLFLDEIGDMPLPMQVKLLRVLQERVIERVGNHRSIPIDVRIIAATHRDLEKEIEEGRFREDLFYRLSVFPLETPALRQRISDLPLLTESLVSRLRDSYGTDLRFSTQVFEVLRGHHWPGNVRELSNLVERLAVVHADGVIGVADLPAKYRPDGVLPEMPELHFEDTAGDDALTGSMALLPSDGLVLKDHLASLEVDLIRQALEQSNGVVAHTAKLLGMRRTTLVEKLRKYDLNREDQAS